MSSYERDAVDAALLAQIDRALVHALALAGRICEGAGLSTEEALAASAAFAPVFRLLRPAPPSEEQIERQLTERVAIVLPLHKGQR